MTQNIVDTQNVDCDDDLPPLCVECGERPAGLHGFCYECEGDTNDD
ncbi:hypothetical protein AAEJ42_21000 [Shewanella algae]